MILQITNSFLVNFLIELAIIFSSLYLIFFGIKLIFSKKLMGKYFFYKTPKDFYKKRDKFVYLLSEDDFQKELKKELKPDKSFLSFLTEFKSFKD